MTENIIVINTCDAYEDVWEIFFCSFKEYWPGCNYKLVLNTESKTLKLNSLDIHTYNFNSPSGKDMWGLRLKKTLKNCESKYIIMLYDDFILEGYVDQDKIVSCMKWLEDNPDIAVFYFNNNPSNNNIDDDNFDGFELIPKKGMYSLNSSPAIWRREKLIKYIDDNDTPWAWEFFGSYRTFHSTDLFYCAKKYYENIYPYNYSLGGAIYRGKWVPGVVLDKIEKYGLNIDLSKRGIVVVEELPKRSFFWKIKFFLLGFRMIRTGAFIVFYRILKAKLSEKNS